MQPRGGKFDLHPLPQSLSAQSSVRRVCTPLCLWVPEAPGDVLPCRRRRAHCPREPRGDAHPFTGQARHPYLHRYLPTKAAWHGARFHGTEFEKEVQEEGDTPPRRR